MKRDIDLIRYILKQIENSDDIYVEIEEIPGYNNHLTYSHLYLLKEAGFVETDIAMTEGGNFKLTGNVRLTWNGHEFLDAAKNDKIWSEAKSILKKKSIDLPVALLHTLLIKLINIAVFQE